jgi:hypothetical protein
LCFKFKFHNWCLLSSNEVGGDKSYLHMGPYLLCQWIGVLHANLTTHQPFLGTILTFGWVGTKLNCTWDCTSGVIELPPYLRLS